MQMPRFGMRKMMVGVAVAGSTLGLALRYPILWLFLAMHTGPPLLWTIISPEKWRHREPQKALAQAFNYFTRSAVLFSPFAAVVMIWLVVSLTYSRH